MACHGRSGQLTNIQDGFPCPASHPIDSIYKQKNSNYIKGCVTCFIWESFGESERSDNVLTDTRGLGRRATPSSSCGLPTPRRRPRRPERRVGTLFWGGREATRVYRVERAFGLLCVLGLGKPKGKQQLFWGPFFDTYPHAPIVDECSEKTRPQYFETNLTTPC